LLAELFIKIFSVMIPAAIMLAFLEFGAGIYRRIRTKKSSKPDKETVSVRSQKLVAVVHILEDGTYSLWQLDLPSKDLDVIEEILSRNETCGCAISGTKEQIIDELSHFPYTEA